MALAYNQLPDEQEAVIGKINLTYLVDGVGDDLAVPNVPGAGEGDAINVSLSIAGDFTTISPSSIVDKPSNANEIFVPEIAPSNSPPFTGAHATWVRHLYYYINNTLANPVYVAAIERRPFDYDGDTSLGVPLNIFRITFVNQTSQDIYFVDADHPSVALLNTGTPNIKVDGTPALVLEGNGNGFVTFLWDGNLSSWVQEHATSVYTP